MAVLSKPQDAGDQHQPPRTEDEVKRLRDAVLFAWEHLHTVVKNNGASAAPSNLQQVAQQLMDKGQQIQAASPQQLATHMVANLPHMQPHTAQPPKSDTTRPNSLNERKCTTVVRDNKPQSRQSRL